jgi:hypothetical protein
MVPATPTKVQLKSSVRPSVRDNQVPTESMARNPAMISPAMNIPLSITALRKYSSARPELAASWSGKNRKMATSRASEKIPIHMVIRARDKAKNPYSAGPRRRTRRILVPIASAKPIPRPSVTTVSCLNNDHSPSEDLMASEASLVPLSEMEKGVGGRLEDVDLSMDDYSDVARAPNCETGTRALEMPAVCLHHLGAGGFGD